MLSTELLGGKGNSSEETALLWNLHWTLTLLLGALAHGISISLKRQICPLSAFLHTFPSFGNRRKGIVYYTQIQLRLVVLVNLFGILSRKVEIWTKYDETLQPLAYEKLHNLPPWSHNPGRRCSSDSLSVICRLRPCCGNICDGSQYLNKCLLISISDAMCLLKAKWKPICHIDKRKHHKLFTLPTWKRTHCPNVFEHGPGPKGKYSKKTNWFENAREQEARDWY